MSEQTSSTPFNELVKVCVQLNNEIKELKKYILNENLLTKKIYSCDYTIDQLLDLKNVETRGIADVEKLLELGFTEEELMSAVMEVWSA